MMKYPIPFQRDFFAYFGEKKELVGGEPLTFSRGKPTEYTALVQQELERRGWIWKWVPFVEGVMVTGAASFNAHIESKIIDQYITNDKEGILENDNELDDTIQHTGNEGSRRGIQEMKKGWQQTRYFFAQFDSGYPPIALWVVTSKNRLWLGDWFAQGAVFLVNIVQSMYGRMRLDAGIVMNEDDIDCLFLKQANYSVILVYQLAHLTMWYTKFQNSNWNIYESNERMLEYLPLFPSAHVIGLGITKQSGKYSMIRGVERFFGHNVRGLVEILFGWCITGWVSLKSFVFGGQRYITSSGIWKHYRDTDLIRLQWKTMHKGDS